MQDMEKEMILDDSAIEVVADINSQLRALQVAKEAVVAYFCKLKGLSPIDWILSQDQKTLTRRTNLRNEMEMEMQEAALNRPRR